MLALLDCLYQVFSEGSFVCRRGGNFLICWLIILYCNPFVNEKLFYPNSNIICLYTNRLKKDFGSQKEEMPGTDQGKKS